jgi:hypothetical protein
MKMAAITFMNHGNPVRYNGALKTRKPFVTHGKSTFVIASPNIERHLF